MARRKAPKGLPQSCPGDKERHLSTYYGCHYREPMCDVGMRKLELVVERWKRR